MADHFSSPKRRIARAKEHLDEIERRGKSYFDSKPYATMIETDAKTGNQVHKVKFTVPVPDALTNLTFECAEALRSALDQAAFAAAISAGNMASKHAYFPIADSKSELDNVIKGRCKNLPPDIVTFFRLFSPYKGGNDPVWALNKICNSSKHKLIVPVSMVVGGMKINQMVISNGIIPFPKWDAVNNEIVFGIVRPSGDFKYDLELTHFIAFGEIETVKGKPVIPTLDQIASIVEGIVLGTEAEATRLGLIK